MPPPYGGPHPSYGAMYPPGGMYGHPMYGQYGTPAPEAMTGVEQADGKPEAKAEGAKQTPLKRSKGSKGSLQLLKVSESGGKGNGVSQSSNGDDNENDGETGSDGSTDGSREENAQNLLGGKRSFEQMTIEAVGAAPYMAPPPGAVVGAPPPVGPPGSGGSLDMSLDYWSAGSVPQPKGGKRASGSPSTSAPPAELWLTDEREVKRQRRKQSNRESARRSRLRKQAECEELGTRVDTLTVENMALRTELSRVTEECKRLQVENSNLVQKIRSTPPPELTAAMPASDSAAAPAAPAENEVAVSNKEIEESQGNANGNVKAKEEKPAGERFSSSVYCID
jgi:plant G-box-binding factor